MENPAVLGRAECQWVECPGPSSHLPPTMLVAALTPLNPDPRSSGVLLSLYLSLIFGTLLGFPMPLPQKQQEDGRARCWPVGAARAWAALTSAILVLKCLSLWLSELGLV